MKKVIFALSLFTQIAFAQTDVYVKDLHIDVSTFSQRQLNQLFESLDLLKNVKLDGPDRPPIIPGILNPNYYEYLKSHIRSLVGPTEQCPSGQDTLACAGNGEMVIRTAAFANRRSILASILVHETRHLDGEFVHVACANIYERQNGRSCDEDQSTGASLAVQIEFLSRVYFYAKTLPPEERIAARNFALYLALNKINKPAIHGTPVALLVRSDGALALFDGLKPIPYAANAGAADLFSRDRGFNLVPRDRSQPSSYFDAYLGQILPAENDKDLIGPVFYDYNTSWSPAARASLKSVLRFGMAGASAVWTDKGLKVVTPTGELPLSPPEPVARLAAEIPCSTEGDADFYVVGESLKVWAVHQAAFTPLNCKWPRGLNAFVKLITENVQSYSKEQMIKLKEPFYREYMIR